jgi:RNA polymerase sigma-70 factor (ECF subfamily)
LAIINQKLTVAYRIKLLLEKTLRFFNPKLKGNFMATTQIPDALLVKNYIAGNENALAILINRHQSKIYGFIYSKMADRDVADDIFQDTFIKVIKTLKSNSYNEEGKFLPWVMRISHNLIVDHYRKNKKMPMLRETEEFSIFSVLTDSSLNIEGKIITDVIENDLKKIIQELPEDQKEVLMMRIYQDYSFNEIAELTGVSINTALGRMRYALLNLRKVIEKNQIILTN